MALLQSQGTGEEKVRSAVHAARRNDEGIFSLEVKLGFSAYVLPEILSLGFPGEKPKY